jgi:hypothetical protein
MLHTRNKCYPHIAVINGVFNRPFIYPSKHEGLTIQKRLTATFVL